MKKLKLRALELGANEVLTRAQLKNVLGGKVVPLTSGVTCFTVCRVDHDCIKANECQNCFYITGATMGYCAG